MFPQTKTALDIAPVKAILRWNTAVVEDRKYLSLKRAGGFRLTFASGENKTYDWENAALITLSVTELGDVLAFAANKDLAEQKIYHDPNLGNPDLAGKTRKELVVKRIGGGKPGYFFNLLVTDKEDAQRRWSLAVTEGEMQVILTLIQATLPELLAIQSKATIERPTDLDAPTFEPTKFNSNGPSKNGASSKDVHEETSTATSTSTPQQPRKKWGQ